MFAPERPPRANLVILAIFLVVTVPFVCVMLMRPAIGISFAHLLSPRAWRIIRPITFALFGATVLYGLTKGRRRPIARR